MMADLRDNQIAAFYPGASGQIDGYSVEEAAQSVRYGLVGPTLPSAMCDHAKQINAAGSRLIYDPSQQIVALSGDDLVAGIENAWALVGNDYEFAMIEQKTGLTIDALTERVPLLVVTYGADGSEFRKNGTIVKIPAATAQTVADPTGAGDAFRAGLIKGLLIEAETEIVGRIASVAATFAVEQLGTQEHTYTIESFVERFETAFPDYTGAISAQQFRA
jgi:adenosine kinase